MQQSERKILERGQQLNPVEQSKSYAVTPEGVLRLAKCHASATLESLRASSREHLPRQKLM